MAHQQITFSQLKQQALRRLGNTRFWDETEVGLWINEAIRIWNLLTFQWSDTQTPSISAGTWLYQHGLVNSTVTDQDILNEAQYLTVEKPNNGLKLTTDLWELTDWFNSLNHRAHQFIRETRLRQVRGTQATSIGTNTYDLSSVSANLIEIQRAAWVADADGESSGLHTSDHFVLDHFYDYDSSNDTPQIYLPSSLQDSLNVEIHPAPDAAGTLDLIFTELGSTLRNTGVTISLPDDFAPYLRWGMLASLFSQEGPANDSTRAQYAEARFREGIVLAQNWLENRPMRVTYNGTALDHAIIEELDTWYGGWQNDEDTPLRWVPVGAFSLIVHPSTDGTISVRGATDAPVLTYDSDYLDLPLSDVGLLLDYAEHVALFKLPGTEFERSMQLLERFLDAAKLRGQRLDMRARFRRWMGFDE